MSSNGQLKNASGTQDQDLFLDALISSLPAIYDKESRDTVISKLFSAVSKQFVKIDRILESVQNNNFLSVDIENEIISRGSGDKDILQYENAYELVSIRVTPKGTYQSQNAKMIVGDNEINLLYTPEDIDFIIYDANDTTQASIEFPTSYNISNNTLTVTSNREGIFTIKYLETGDVIRTNQNVEVPPNLFKLGFGEGGFGELGYGE